MAHTQAYVENLVTALQRTRTELKDIILSLSGDLNTAEIHKLQMKMHRMVASISDDLNS